MARTIQCKHGQEYCATDVEDFREMNAEARRDSQSQLARKQTKQGREQVRKVTRHLDGDRRTALGIGCKYSSSADLIQDLAALNQSSSYQYSGWRLCE
jgi:hypothetical protein